MTIFINKKRAVTTSALVAAMFISLGGCASTRQDLVLQANQKRLGALINQPRHFENEAVVVIGTNLKESVTYGLYKFDETGKGSGVPIWQVEKLCGFGTCDEVTYHVFYMPPGTYGLAYVASKQRTDVFVNSPRYVEKRMVQGNRFSGIVMDDPRLSLDTPRFSVSAGEVVYVGDFKIETGETKISVSRSINEKGAREELADMGETRPVTTRPWKTAKEQPSLLKAGQFSAPMIFSH